MKKALWLSVACLLSLWAAQAQATPITTLFNTGVNSSGTVRADSTVGDLHYTLTSVPLTSTSDTLIRTSAGGVPIPPYLGNNVSSAWIGPNNAHNLVSPPGNYRYETTFNLTGFNPSTALVVGNWSTDNPGLNIFLNGSSLGFTTNGDYTKFTPFVISSGFSGGLNTLAFVVSNTGTVANPTALRVEVSGSAAAVPEPDSLLLLLLGSGLLGVAVWRLKKSA